MILLCFFLFWAYILMVYTLLQDGLDLDFMDGRDESGPWSWGHISNKQLMIK